MADLRVTVVEDENEPPGHAIIRVAGLTTPPPKISLTFRPYGDDPAPRDWPVGKQTPRKATLANNVWSLYIGPRIVDRIPAGTPVTIGFVGLGIEASCVWPVLEPSQEDWGPADHEAAEGDGIATEVLGAPGPVKAKAEPPPTTDPSGGDGLAALRAELAATKDALDRAHRDHATLAQALAEAQAEATRRAQEQAALDLRLSQSEDTRQDLEQRLSSLGPLPDRGPGAEKRGGGIAGVIVVGILALLFGVGGGASLLYFFPGIVPGSSPTARGGAAQDALDLALLRSLARDYALGSNGVVQNPETGAVLYRMAGLQGYPDQQRDLQVVVTLVRTDYPRDSKSASIVRTAEALLRIAASRGSGAAMYELALLYRESGPLQNLDLARHWARSAVERADDKKLAARAQELVDALKKG